MKAYLETWVWHSCTSYLSIIVCKAKVSVIPHGICACIVLDSLFVEQKHFTQGIELAHAVKVCWLLYLQIALECLIASVLCVFGVVSLMGKFKDIKLTTELNSQSFETVDNRLGFMTFNHRTISWTTSIVGVLLFLSNHCLAVLILYISRLYCPPQHCTIVTASTGL